MRHLASPCKRAAVLAVTAFAVLATPAIPAVPAFAEDRPETWNVALTPDRDDLGVHSADGALRLDPQAPRPAGILLDQPEGSLLSGVHRLAAPVGRISMHIDDTLPAGTAVAVAVRGLTQHGSWTEWVPVDQRTPATLGAMVSAVQTRLVLLGGPGGQTPTVHGLALTAVPGQVPTARAAQAQSAARRVYATREGLVGRKTANGHVILPRDHFVALPSRRSLNASGSGDYTVKVCTDNGRCEWAPVWDVGPWNTTDDYWNDPDERQSWRDLPQGLPQAQAAYQHGYNNGLDQFGRRVANPAGIDLADGMFWDGLGLRDNSWVTVTYLWGGDGLWGTVRSGMLNVRTGPGTNFPVVGLATQNARLLVECTANGSNVRKWLGNSDQWLRVGPNQYVSAPEVDLPGSGRPC